MPPRIRQGLSKRTEFAALLNTLNLVNESVEVGTHQGHFAESFLKAWKGKTLYGIDPYEPLYDPMDPAALGDRKKDKLAAISRLARFQKRFKPIYLSSVEASKQFPNDSLDFVFVDGCHQYSSVLEDLKTWFPKVATKGVIAGHDLICPGEPSGLWENTIQPALFEFLGSLEKSPDLFLVPEDREQPWSYFFFKP